MWHTIIVVLSEAVLVIEKSSEASKKSVGSLQLAVYKKREIAEKRRENSGKKLRS